MSAGNYYCHYLHHNKSNGQSHLSLDATVNQQLHSMAHLQDPYSADIEPCSSLLSLAGINTNLGEERVYVILHF